MTSIVGNESEVRSVIGLQFPKSRILNIQHINIGITRQTYAVMIKVESKSKEYIVQSYKKTSRNDNTLREYQNLSYINRHLDGISKEIYVRESQSGLLYIIKERLDGSILLAPKNKKDYCRKLAQTIYQIHQIPLNAVVNARIPTVLSKIDDFRNYPWKNIRLNHFDKMLQALQTNDYRTQERVLNHGDLWMGNFLWKEDEISGVIDWEDARIGTRYYDLGIARFELFLAFGMTGMDAFTKEYSCLYGPLDRHLLTLYDLAALFRVVGGVSGWAEIWDDFDRPDINKELFYDRIERFYDLVENSFQDKYV